MSFFGFVALVAVRIDSIVINGWWWSLRDCYQFCEFVLFFVFIFIFFIPVWVFSTFSYMFLVAVRHCCTLTHTTRLLICPASYHISLFSASERTIFFFFIYLLFFVYLYLNASLSLSLFSLPTFRLALSSGQARKKIAAHQMFNIINAQICKMIETCNAYDDVPLLLRRCHYRA